MLDFEFEEDKIEAFRQASSVTKDQIISSINYALISAEAGNNDDKLFKNHSASFRKLYIELLRKFRDKVEETKLFDELEPYWSYSFDIDDSGASLHLCYMDDVDFDDNGNISFEMCEQDFELLKVHTRLLTVEEYASIYDVTVGAVRQWIRRGKLRSAVKAGREWRIPELSEVTNRGYRWVNYEWTPYLDDFPEEYSFLRDYSAVSINQSDDDKSKFIVTAAAGKKENMSLTMDTKEREKFELYLISHPLIKASSEHFGSFA